MLICMNISSCISVNVTVANTSTDAKTDTHTFAVRAIWVFTQAMFGTGDAAVGNPHRAQLVQFELFELIVLLKSDSKFPVQQFEATASQSTVPSTLLNSTLHMTISPSFQLTVLSTLPRCYSNFKLTFKSRKLTLNISTYSKLKGQWNGYAINGCSVEGADEKKKTKKKGAGLEGFRPPSPIIWHDIHIP